MDDSDVEVEDFEITEEDLLNEINPNRKKFRFTKEDAIYGVFAPDYGSNYQHKNKGKDYTKPVDFVSGGISGKASQDSKSIQDRDNSSNEHSGSDDNENVDEIILQSLQETQDSDKQLPKQVDNTKSTQSNPSSRKDRSISNKHKHLKKPDKEFGKWQAHTTGFGQKYLERFGFKTGRGLGKTQEGIARPVEVTKRKGPGGLAYYGSERTKSSKEDYPVYDSEEEEKQKFEEELQKWKKSGKATSVRKKYVYKTIDEIKSGATNKLSAETFSGSKDKVIDMTGPQSRVLSGYSAIAGKPTKPTPQTMSEAGIHEANFSMVELQSNLSLLVDLAESDIIQIDIQLKNERKKMENLKHEQERLNKIITDDQKNVERLEELNSIIDKCSERLSSKHNPLTLDDCSDIFRNLQRNFADEYKMYGLADLAVSIVYPLIKNYLRGWMPLKDPTFCLKTYTEWNALLSDNSYINFDCTGSTMSIFDRMMWETWLPIVRDVIISIKPVRNPESLINLIDIWQGILPSWIKSNILDQLIFPQLQREVETWNPLTDRIPIHTWLHPWLPLLGNQLEPLFAPIRHKLTIALTNWHPSDQSARLIIQPWKGVFRENVFDAFLCRSVLPKLAACLAEFVINPHQQHLEPFLWVMDWKNVIAIQHLVSLMERHFFPKWLQALKVWLNHKPNYKEVTKWYEGWKEMFGSELVSLPAIKVHFHRGLDIMNKSISLDNGPSLSDNRENLAHFASIERRNAAEIAVKQRAAAIAKAKTDKMTFKDMVQKLAENHGLLFTPARNTHQDGKLLYNFGSLVINIDRGVVYIQTTGNKYEPVALSELVNLAN